MNELEHIQLLRQSYRNLTGQDLVEAKLNASESRLTIEAADFALLSHTADDEPVFNYANGTALKLFEMEASQLIGMPSRESAESENQIERKRLLREVSTKGFIENYSGIRVSASGRRFLISKALVWNLVDDQGNFKGQAARFSDWEFLD